MTNYPIPANPVYNPEIEEITKQKKVVDTVINPVLTQMIENTHYLRKHAPYEGEISGEATALIFTMDEGFELGDGDIIRGVMPFNIGEGATASVAGVGAIPIMLSDGEAVTEDSYVEGSYLTIRYNEEQGCFFVLGGSTGASIKTTPFTGTVMEDIAAGERCMGSVVVKSIQTNQYAKSSPPTGYERTNQWLALSDDRQYLVEAFRSTSNANTFLIVAYRKSGNAYVQLTGTTTVQYIAMFKFVPNSHKLLIYSSNSTGTIRQIDIPETGNTLTNTVIHNVSTEVIYNVESEERCILTSNDGLWITFLVSDSANKVYKRKIYKYANLNYGTNPVEVDNSKFPNIPAQTISNTAAANMDIVVVKHIFAVTIDGTYTICMRINYGLRVYTPNGDSWENHAASEFIDVGGWTHISYYPLDEDRYIYGIADPSTTVPKMAFVLAELKDGIYNYFERDLSSLTVIVRGVPFVFLKTDFDDIGVILFLKGAALCINGNSALNWSGIAIASSGLLFANEGVTIDYTGSSTHYIETQYYLENQIRKYQGRGYAWINGGIAAGEALSDLSSGDTATVKMLALE